MPDPAQIWRRIKICLRAANAPEVARKLGLTKQSVYEWEKKVPGLESLLAISESGNASLHWLLTGEGPREISELKAAELPLLNPRNLEIFVQRIVREELASGRLQNGNHTNELPIPEYDDSKPQSQIAPVMPLTLMERLEQALAVEGLSMPDDFMLSFHGWNELSDEDKEVTVEQVKQLAITALRDEAKQKGRKR